jgi:hypothetical protein
MDAVYGTGIFSTKELDQINRVRQYKKVTSIGDLVGCDLGCQLLSNYSVITVITVFWVSDFGYCLFLRRVTIKIGESIQQVRRK